MKEERFEMIAKTLYGLEDVLAAELTALHADDVQVGRRMVSFKGDKAMLYKTNLHCRTALRILKPLAHFKATNADTVYTEVKNIEWDNYLSPNQTFAIDAVINSESFNHSKYVAYRTKDAIVDYFNEKLGQRPSVRLNNPDMYIHIHISHQDCTVSLDSSGESLHKRGYRLAQGEAPLNEVLAAGMILLTGWRGESNFIDPMCGSGTLLIEAAMIAMNIPPGLYRREYAFEQWRDFDRELFDEIYQDESGEREFNFKCYGSDISPKSIEMAEQNIRNAGLSRYIELKTLPFQQYAKAPLPGILVTNPPYGERISANDITNLYTMIGERLKHAFTGYQAWILSYKEECFDNIGLRPGRKIKLMNGSLDCEFRCYELFKGTNKEYKTAQRETKHDRQDAKSAMPERKREFQGEKPPFPARKREIKGEKSVLGERRREMQGERPALSERKRDFNGEKPPFSARKREIKGEKPVMGEKRRGMQSEKPALSERKRDFNGEKPPFPARKREIKGEKPVMGERRRGIQGEKPAFKADRGYKVTSPATEKRTEKSSMTRYRSQSASATDKQHEKTSVARRQSQFASTADKRSVKSSVTGHRSPSASIAGKRSTKPSATGYKSQSASTDGKQYSKPAIRTDRPNSKIQRPAGDPKSTRKAFVKKYQSPQDKGKKR